MKRFARKDTIDSMNLFYDVMLCDRNIKSKEEKEDVEASYFAMCLLLPEKAFMNIVNSFGGIDESYKEDNVRTLARIFRVEKKLIRVRLKDLASKTNEKSDLDNSNVTYADDARNKGKYKKHKK